MVYFPDTQIIKRVRCVKFPKEMSLTQSHENSGYAEIPLIDDFDDKFLTYTKTRINEHDQTSTETETENQSATSEEYT